TPAVQRLEGIRLGLGASIGVACPWPRFPLAKEAVPTPPPAARVSRRDGRVRRSRGWATEAESQGRRIRARWLRALLRAARRGDKLRRELIEVLIRHMFGRAARPDQ